MSTQSLPPTNFSALKSVVMPLLIVGLLGLAGWVLWHQLAGLDAAAVARAMGTLQTWQYVVAGLLLCCSYGGYGWLEWLAAAHLGRPLSLIRAGLTGLAAQGISLSTGKGFVVGGLVRVRLLARWGYTVPQGVGATAVVTLHGNAGLLVLLAVLCALGGPWSWTWWLVAGTAAGAVAWLILCWKAAPITWRDIVITPPTVSAALKGIAAGGGEKLACVLLAAVVQPAGLDIPLMTFLAVMIVALAAARLSQIPGGLGVLEASVLGLWPVTLTDAAKTELIAGLLVFRVAYYLLPLIAAVPVLACCGWSSRTSTARCDHEPIPHSPDHG